MPLPRITSEEMRLNRLAKDLRDAADEADLNIQHVFSSHLVLAGAGHVENSVIHILSEYGRRNGNPIIRRFVERTVSRSNSLNCEKIKAVADQFDLEWWEQITEATTETQREAVNSLKTLRDQIAHGRRNGTGFTVVNGYLTEARDFIREVNRVILE